MHFSKARLNTGEAEGKAALEHRRTGNFNKATYAYKAMPITLLSSLCLVKGQLRALISNQSK